MSNKIQQVLPVKWIQHLTNLPETGMGYQMVDVYLNDGKILRSKEIINSSIINLDENINLDNIISIKLIKI